MQSARAEDLHRVCALHLCECKYPRNKSFENLMHSEDSLTHKPVNSRRKLARVLIIKGVCDLLFVVMLVLISAYTMVGAKVDR